MVSMVLGGVRFPKTTALTHFEGTALSGDSPAEGLRLANPRRSNHGVRRPLALYRRATGVANNPVVTLEKTSHPKGFRAVGGGERVLVTVIGLSLLGLFVLLWRKHRAGHALPCMTWLN